MKQTNNAIKFLMAQYRAIFKNANLKMFLAAATAAAALAATQAQAASPLNSDATWKALEGAVTVGAADSNYNKIEIQDADGKKYDNAGKEFTLTILGGENTIAGGAENAVVKAASGSVILNGGQASLKIGGVSQKSGATVTLKEFKGLAGTLSIGGSDQQSALEAGTITLQGAAADATTKAATPAVTVKLGKSGALGGTDSAITIGTGAALSIENGATKTSINGASLNIKGGSVNVAANQELDIHSATVDVESLSDFTNAGTVKFDKATNVTFAAGTIKNSGTIDLNANGANLTLAASDFSATGLFEKQGKVTASGSDANKVYSIKLTGSDAVDLGLLLKGDGSALKEDKVHVKQGKLSFEADTVNFSGNKIAVLKSGTFGSLTTSDQTKKLNIEGTAVTVSKVLTVKGASDTEHGALVLDSAGELHLAGNGGTVNAKSITVGGTGKGVLSVDSGTWNANSLTITSGSATVDTGSKLVISGGDLTTKDNDNKLTVKGTLDISNAGTVKLLDSGTALTGGTLIVAKDDLFTVNGDTVALTPNNIGTTKPIDGDTGSILQINDVGNMSVAAIKDLKKKLAGFNGFLQFGGENSIESQSGDKTWDDIKTDASVSGIYDNVTVAADTIDGSASIGNIELTTENGTEATINNATVILNNASANDSTKKFVANKGGAKAVGLKLQGDNSKVYFISEGEVGAITTVTKDKSSVIVGHSKGAGQLTVNGGVGSSANPLKDVQVTSGSSLTIAGTEDTDGLYANQLTMDSGAVLSAKGRDVVLGSGAMASTLNGKVEAKTLTLNGTGKHTIAGGAEVNVETLTGANGGFINVGSDLPDGGSATVIAKKLELKGATLNIDPVYERDYAATIVSTLSGTDLSVNDAGTLDGHINVGQNSVFAVGFDNRDQVTKTLGSWLDNGHFTQPTPQTKAGDPAPDNSKPVASNALILNKHVNLDATHGIYVGTSGKGASGNQVDVEAGSVLVITENAFTDPNTGKKTQPAITANGGTGTADIKGNTYLTGNYTAKDQLTIVSGLTDPSSLNSLKVTLENDLLNATVENGTIKLKLTEDQTKIANAYKLASTPVHDLLIAYTAGTLDGDNEPGYVFIGESAKDTASGAIADAAAHAATYAGAQVAAVASVGTMADAVSGRVGSMGVEASAIAATGSAANGGVWISPMYKSVDADGFGAQGASYGADVDLAGVAFGADTVNGNMRFGAVFNIGSGDSDGKGNGKGLKDDFDYYGFGMYTAMNFGQFALVGDASLNVISHDVSGESGMKDFGKLKGSADTTAVTMGVTGQYTISNPAVDVTPHLGARLIRLDTDSYDLTSNKGTVATTDFDVQNVFSIPLGVTLSKSMEMGGWSLAPSADLTLTFNTGDTDAKSSTQFTGVKAIDLTSEVLDEVTYGVALGLGAQYGAFGTQIGINYTGSSNTDSFGVNAQARYMF